MTLQNKILKLLTDKQRQTLNQLANALEMNPKLLKDDIKRMLERGVLTRDIVGGNRYLLTTEYVISNNIKVADKYYYTPKKRESDQPTTNLDGQLLVNRLLNKGLAAL